ncbi:MAG: hypothetical protein A2Y89_06755 [Chloroflexi bacterium RBG_13_51_18]|nr:MAG: hypothetical protein A2Y89_06755 [Chloroflexi bacterium RBG_13_51_18]
MPCSIIAQRYAEQAARLRLNKLIENGLGPASEPFKQLSAIRNQLMSSLGIKRPTVNMLIRLMLALSPGSVKLFYNSDSGWFTEARERAGAPPVYHHVDDDTAIKILRGEYTHEDFEKLKIPDDYLGE